MLIGDKPSTVRGKHEHNADVYTFTKWLNTIHGVHGTAIYDTWDDSGHAPRVTIIDDVLVRRQFGDASPLGARLRIQIGQFRDEWVEVVGVVGHVRDDSPEEQGRSQIYFPEAQRPQDRGALVVRTAGDAAGFTSAVIGQIHAEEPNQPVYDVRSTRAWLQRTMQSRNLVTGLIILFGIASLVLACLGLYGVVSYTAGLRRCEFGIRTALGATPSAVHGLVLRQAGWLAIAGCAVGLLCAWPASRVLQKMLYGVRSTDPLTLIGAPALLIAVALLAGLGPAIRASHVDPADSLRLD
ncbi:MAG TPA: FtsX-like permease family protein [Bryobacteraceae bacterium]